MLGLCRRTSLQQSVTMSEIIQVATTVESRTEAQQLCRSLVDQRLVACAQISGPIESCYRWQGEIETSQEWLCTFKTLQDRYPQLEEAIRTAHSYDEPEILATQVTAASSGYEQWVRQSLG